MTQVPEGGIYRHYKGALYKVLFLAHDANHEDRTVVVYMPLQLDGAHLGYRPAVRTIEDFTAQLHISQAGDNWPTCPYPDAECRLLKRTAVGTVDLPHYDKTHQPRFTHLGGSGLTAEMLPGVTQ